MRQKLTNNLGLKLISIAVAFILWLVVVSIDDPVITRNYSGIEVEILNADAVTSQGKVYEVLDGSNIISVSISAKRSVLEKMSRDYIKATADLKEMTILNSVSIDVRTTRYSDMISSITPLTKNLKVEVEDLEKKQLSINVETVGIPAKGYVVGSNSPSVNITSISGPKSAVSKLARAVATVDVSGATSNIRASSRVVLYDGNGDVVNNSALTVGVTEILVDIDILATKEIPVMAAISGTPAEGYASTGKVAVSPDTILVAGSGSAFKSLEGITIPADDVSINGATGDVTHTFDINDYLPGGIRLATNEYDGNVEVTVYIGKLENTIVDVPTANIVIDNIPEGFQASLVDIGGSKRIEIQGLNEVITGLDASRITGTIDASGMTPRDTTIEGIHAGSYDASVRWNLPAGITIVNSSMMEVSLYPTTDNTALIALPQEGVAGIAGQTEHTDQTEE
ncbi:MAG TPA: hypothetical protein DIS78_06160 [Lachnospiraceae bacterium]|nr:hypothetical protein [Lachnospiraceae bacterium]